MNKTLRIVAKDTRHLWPEILLSLAIASAFVAIEPMSWQFYKSRLQMMPMLLNCVNILLPLTWWLLIARVVQDESLVGDRQFWITRPYKWHRVLAAKVIFVATFIAAPMFLTKVALLHRAGLVPWHSISALLANVLCTTGTILLVFFALAAITSNLTRMIVTAIGFAVYVFVAASINSWIGFSERYGPDTTPSWILPLCIGVLVLVIFLQYAGRRTALSRTILIATVLLVTLYISVNEHTWTRQRMYPDLAEGEISPLALITANGPATVSASNIGEEAAGGNRTIQIAELLDENGDFRDPENQKKSVWMSIPLTATIAANHSVRIDHLVVTYSLPGHKIPISSVKQPNREYLPGESFDGVDFSLSADEFQAFKDQLLTIHLTYAVVESEALEASAVLASKSAFGAPGRGLCLQHPWSNQQQCRFPIGEPQHSLISAYLSDQPCNQATTSGAIDRTWIGQFADGSWSPELDPVHEEEIHFSQDVHEAEGRRFQRVLCPGTSITFTPYRVVRNRTLYLTLPPIRPSDYVRK